MRQRAAAIVIQDNQILLMERRKNGKHYWVFPGGGVEQGESLEEAVLREVMEETSITVKVEKLLYEQFYTFSSGEKDSGHFYLCMYISGEPALGDANEREDSSESNVYKPQWVSLDILPELLLYPLEIRDWLLQDLKNNFANTPRSESLKIDDLIKAK